MEPKSTPMTDPLLPKRLFYHQTSHNMCTVDEIIPKARVVKEACPMCVLCSAAREMCWNLHIQTTKQIAFAIKSHLVLGKYINGGKHTFVFHHLGANSIFAISPTKCLPSVKVIGLAAYELLAQQPCGAIRDRGGRYRGR